MQVDVVFVKSDLFTSLIPKYKDCKVISVEDLHSLKFDHYTELFTTAKHFPVINSLPAIATPIPKVHITYFANTDVDYARLYSSTKCRNISVIEVPTGTTDLSKLLFTKIYIEKSHRDNALRLNNELRSVWNKYFHNYNIKSLTHLFYYQLTCPFTALSPFIRELESDSMKALIHEQIEIHSRSKNKGMIDKCCEEICAIVKRFKPSKCTTFPDKPTISYTSNRIKFEDTNYAYTIDIKPDVMDKLRKFYRGCNFLVDAFTMLYRYQTLGRLGKDTMQLSLPDSYHEDLSKNGYNVECFGSPINRHFDLLFTAFPDTDMCFGALGSFFDNGYEVLMSGEYSGSCDCPYQIHAIENCVDLIHKILEESSYKHKFSFALPLWKDADFYTKLKDSKFMKTFEEIEQDKLKYKLHKVSDDDQPIFPCASLISVQSNE